MFISPLRRSASLLILLLLVSLIGGIWFVTNPQRISRMTQILLSNVLGADVEVKSGHLSFAGTLQLTGVEVKMGRGNEPRTTLLAADQVEMRFDWLSLLVGQLKASQITAIRPRLNLVEDRATQRWNYERWEREPGPNQPGESAGVAALAGNLPVIILREARVQWAETNNGVYTDTASTVVDAQLTPDANNPSAYRFQEDERSDAPSGLPKQVTGFWDVAQGRVSTVAHDVDLSERLKRSMPRAVREIWDEHQLAGTLKELRINADSRQGLVVTVVLDRVSGIAQLDEKNSGALGPVTLPFRNMRGELSFAVTLGHLQFRKLEGLVLEWPFQIDGELGGLSGEAPFNLQVSLPRVILGNPYPPLLTAFPPARDLMNRLMPRGEMAISVSLRRSLWNHNVFVNGQVDCKRLRARFIHFPYPMTDLTGPITFYNETIRFNNVHAVAGESPVILDGVCGTTSRNHTIDFTVTSDRTHGPTVFDDRILGCLPARFQNVWTAFEPAGTGWFECHVTRGAAAEAEQHVSVLVEPVNMRAMFSRFPYPLHNIHGKLRIADEETTVDLLQGKVGKDDSGDLTLTGIVKYPGGDLEKVAPQVTLVGKNLPLERLLLDAMPDSYQPWLHKIDASGRLAMNVLVTRGPDESADVTGALHITGGRVGSRDDAWHFDDLLCDAAVRPGHVEIKSLAARLGEKASLHAIGTVDEQNGRMTVDVAGGWKDLLLAPEPPALLPAAAAVAWRKYQPAGPVDGDFRLALEVPAAPTSVEPAATTSATAPSTAPALPFKLTDYNVALRLNGLTLSPESWPEPLTNIRGELAAHAGRIDIKDLSAASGPLVLHTTGMVSLVDDRVDLAVKAQSATMPAKWLTLLPESMASFVTSLKPEGELKADLPHISHHKTEQGADAWEFEGSVALSNLKTTGPLTTTAADLTLAGKGSWGLPDAGLNFTGTLSTRDVVVGGKTFETFKGNMNASAATKSVRLTEIDSKVVGGTLQGSLVVNLEKDPSYEATLVLNDADLAAILLAPNATDADRKRLGTGRVTANLAVKQQFGRQADRTGRGELIVRDGTIYDVPLAMGLMQIVTLRLPTAKAFSSAQMTYYLRDNKVTFERILLESSGFNLAGSGTLGLKDRELDLGFVTETPHEIYFPLWTPFWKGIQNQILQIHVTGPIDSPEIRPVALDAVGSTLRLLLPKPKPSGE